MSEETEAFTASLYIDGIPAGQVGNHGTGGPDWFSDRNAEKRLNDYAAQFMWFTHKDDKTGEDVVHYKNAECLIGEVFEKWLQAKESDRLRKGLARDLAARLMYTKKGVKGIFQSKKVSPAQLQHWLDNETKTRAAVPDMDVILNKLPLDQAWPIFDANIEKVMV
jgi:hypothetical protein